MVLLCTAAVIFQWSSAVMAGQAGTVQELHRYKRITVLHPLVLLHAMLLIWTTVIAIHVLTHNLGTFTSVAGYARDAASLLLAYRVVNTATLTFDVIVACYVATRLRERLLAAAMAEDMKKKSVLQMTLLMALLTASLTLQIIMDAPIIISGAEDSWSSLSFEAFCICKYLVPGVVLSLVFLYIMRRVEQREPRRTMVMPSRSLVEFVECSSTDCVWCAHHQRYHLSQHKWDATLMTPFSPQTVDSSDHSSTYANLSQGSWSSSSTPELLPSTSYLTQDSHHCLYEAYSPHLYAHPSRERVHFPLQTHGDYESPRDILGRRIGCYS